MSSLPLPPSLPLALALPLSLSLPHVCVGRWAKISCGEQFYYLKLDGTKFKCLQLPDEGTHVSHEVVQQVELVEEGLEETEQEVAANNTFQETFAELTTATATAASA
eukprot:COSAG02_NODE_9715_length_2135_cov_1.296169_2_plen_107_part_00